MPICIFGHLKSVLKLDFHFRADSHTWKDILGSQVLDFMVKTYLELKGIIISLAILKIIKHWVIFHIKVVKEKNCKYFPSHSLLHGEQLHFVLLPQSAPNQSSLSESKDVMAESSKERTYKTNQEICIYCLYFKALL